ncbi:MAG: peptidase S24, partial [Sphingomonadaceae bacterium]
MDEADSRAALAQAIRARGLSFAAVSRQIGRNAAYIQQHVHRGVPARLDERDLRAIARLLGVPLAELGTDLPESVAASPDAAAPGDYVV